jgi:hypothetical protein
MQPSGSMSLPKKEILLPGAAARWSAVAVLGITPSATATEQSGAECPPQPAPKAMSNDSKHGKKTFTTAPNSLAFNGLIESTPLSGNQAGRIEVLSILLWL